MRGWRVRGDGSRGDKGGSWGLPAPRALPGYKYNGDLMLGVRAGPNTEQGTGRGYLGRGGGGAMGQEPALTWLCARREGASRGHGVQGADEWLLGRTGRRAGRQSCGVLGWDRVHSRFSRHLPPWGCSWGFWQRSSPHTALAGEAGELLRPAPQQSQKTRGWPRVGPWAPYRIRTSQPPQNQWGAEGAQRRATP